MRLTFSPILLWLGAALIVVCLLPFGLSWYQIETSRDRLIDQAQRTHLLAARTASQRLAARLESLVGLLRTVGNFEDLYINPDSEAARSLLRGAVEAEPGLRGLFLITRGPDQDRRLVFGARTADLPDGIDDELIVADLPAIQLRETGRKAVLIASEETARPNLWLRAVFEDQDLPGTLQPEELGAAAEVFLVDTEDGNTLLAPAGLTNVGDDQLPLLSAEGVRSAVRQMIWPDIGNAVTAFARVPDTRYAVLSRQPLHRAESLSGELRRSAWSMFAAVSLIAIVILMFVARTVVRPIRRLVAEQRELAGITGRHASRRGEIAELGEAFEALKRYVNDRESLSEVFIDRYQVLRRIGTGGMGSVYLGLDPKLKRFVALKTLNFDMLEGPEREQAFQQLREEAVVAASLAHRNIVAIHDIIEGEHGAFIAMELVDGESLSAVLHRVGSLTIAQVMPVAVAILRGLAIAHKNGMVHRDIKPANILIGRNGDIKVTDFGTAAHMTVGRNSQSTLEGTPGYVAPESIINGTFSAASDIFAVAVVIVECVIGYTPFGGRNAQQAFLRTTSGDLDFDSPPYSSIDRSIVTMLRTMLNPEPKERPTAAEALKGLLTAWKQPIVWNDDWFDIKTILQVEGRGRDKTTQTQVLAHSVAD